MPSTETLTVAPVPKPFDLEGVTASLAAGLEALTLLRIASAVVTVPGTIP